MMKKLWITLAALLLITCGLTGCQEDEPSAAGALKDAAQQAPKDHPAH